jgi:hypothetical protein
MEGLNEYVFSSRVQLWVRILQHLPMRSWKNVARVCVFLRRIAQDQMVVPVLPLTNDTRHTAQTRHTRHATLNSISTDTRPGSGGAVQAEKRRGATTPASDSPGLTYAVDRFCIYYCQRLL